MTLRYDAGELITAMVTPMDSTRAVDYEGVEKVSRHLLEQKTDRNLIIDSSLFGKSSFAGVVTAP